LFFFDTSGKKKSSGLGLVSLSVSFTRGGTSGTEEQEGRERSKEVSTSRLSLIPTDNNNNCRRRTTTREEIEFICREEEQW